VVADTDVIPNRQRLAWSLVVAALAAIYVLSGPYLRLGYVSDFDQLHLAARAWRAGYDPYVVVADYWKSAGYKWGLVYPFTAVTAAIPISYLPLQAARVLVASAASFSVSYLVLSRAWWLYPILLSACMRGSIAAVQIAPFVACAVMVPWYGWIAAFKPNVGLPAFAAQRREDLVRFVLPSVALTVLSLILWPRWPLIWLEAAKTGTANRPLVLEWGGALLLLSLLRWRRPEARWLAVMAVVPVNPRFYDAFPLLVFLPRSHRDALLWAILTHVVEIAAHRVAPLNQSLAQLFDHQNLIHARFLLWGLYVPALITILRRPNESS
jgi:hypothetical protein